MRIKIEIEIKYDVGMKEYMVKYGKSACKDHFLGWRRVLPSEGLMTAVIQSGCLPEEPSFLFRILFFFTGGTSRTGIGGGVLHNSSNDGHVNGDSSKSMVVAGFTRLKSIGVSEGGGFDAGMEGSKMD